MHENWWYRWNIYAFQMCLHRIAGPSSNISHCELLLAALIFYKCKITNCDTKYLIAYLQLNSFDLIWIDRFSVIHIVISIFCVTWRAQKKYILFEWLFGVCKKFSRVPRAYKHSILRTHISATCQNSAHWCKFAYKLMFHSKTNIAASKCTANGARSCGYLQYLF